MPNRTWEEVEADLLAESPELRAEVEATRPSFLVARELIRERLAQGLSQSQVAERMGSSQSVVSRLERMETVPNLRTVNDVARALGCELDVRFVRAGSQASATVVTGIRDVDVVGLGAVGSQALAPGQRIPAIDVPAEPMLEVGIPIPWIADLVERLVDDRLVERGVLQSDGA